MTSIFYGFVANIGLRIVQNLIFWMSCYLSGNKLYFVVSVQSFGENVVSIYGHCFAKLRMLH